MGLALVLLSLWTGSAKSVSVCGVNGALAARPQGAATWKGIAGYFIGLATGAILLAAALIVVGLALSTLIPLELSTRLYVAAAILATLGIAQARAGDSVLPHLAWAVPRTWIPWRFGLAIFGLIRGVAVFNHSPFASMHAWMLLLILFPAEQSALLLGLLLAVGLALWSLVDLLQSGGGKSRGHHLLERWSDYALTHRTIVARLDAVALIGLGVGLAMLGAKHGP